MLGLFRRNSPNFEAMSREELEKWRDDFVLKLNIQLAAYNYNRSEETRARRKLYDRITDWTFNISLIVFFGLSIALRLNPNNIWTAAFIFGGAFACGAVAVLYARKKVKHPGCKYIFANYWPTNDGNPETDVSAIPEKPETVGDRLLWLGYVVFWVAQVFFVLFILVDIINRNF